MVYRLSRRLFRYESTCHVLGIAGLILAFWFIVALSSQAFENQNTARVYQERQLWWQVIKEVITRSNIPKADPSDDIPLRLSKPNAQDEMSLEEFFARYPLFKRWLNSAIMEELGETASDADKLGAVKRDIENISALPPRQWNFATLHSLLEVVQQVEDHVVHLFGGDPRVRFKAIFMTYDRESNGEAGYNYLTQELQFQRPATPFIHSETEELNESQVRNTTWHEFTHHLHFEGIRDHGDPGEFLVDYTLRGLPNHDYLEGKAVVLPSDRKKLEESLPGVNVEQGVLEIVAEKISSLITSEEMRVQDLEDRTREMIEWVDAATEFGSENSFGYLVNYSATFQVVNEAYGNTEFVTELEAGVKALIRAQRLITDKEAALMAYDQLVEILKELYQSIQLKLKIKGPAIDGEGTEVLLKQVLFRHHLYRERRITRQSGVPDRGRYPPTTV